MSARSVSEIGRDVNPQDVDRRAGAGHRVHFEALVAVGEAAGEASFEAESIDVSREGMRLRTAYLPEVGERLMCRFDGLGLDVTVEAEVTWRRELARGGEFGVCFLSHDKKTADALRVLCAPPPDPRSDDAARMSARGARVKLHIEGLASPMKARVRDADMSEVQVGSNLEFLKVGRPVDFEDVDQKTKREAYVDHVKVEIDPETSVPQLVVSLRFDGAFGSVAPRSVTPSANPVRAAAAAAPPAPAAKRGEPVAPEKVVPASEKVTPVASAVADEPTLDASARTPSANPAKAAPSAPPPPAREELASDEEEDSAETAEAGPDPSAAPVGTAVSALRSAGTRVAGATTAAMGRLAPAMSAAGERAKGAFDSILERIRKKQGERATTRKRPRRTTAPPPSGALRSDGRRLVRDADEAAMEEVEPRRNPRKAALMGSALGLVAVLGVWGSAKALGLSDDEEPSREIATATTGAPLTAPAAPVAAGGTVATADIPLFGATPLSTTEQVMPPPPAPGEAALAAAKPGPAEGDAEAAAPAGEELPREFGRGEVNNPKVLKIKMDGPISGLSGSEGDSGFTIRVPDRKSLSSVSQLARKDKRIDSVKAVNRADGAEVTVQFKDEVPAFMATAKGDRLEISIGSEKKVASKGSKQKK